MRAVQSSDYVSFDPDAEDTIYVGDLKARFVVGSSEIVWDTSQAEDAPANLTSQWAGFEVSTKTP